MNVGIAKAEGCMKVLLICLDLHVVEEPKQLNHDYRCGRVHHLQMLCTFMAL